jgi:phospholipase C
MPNLRLSTVGVSLALAGFSFAASADGSLRRVNHVVILMQENHSFDNYFGVLPYVPGGPYRAGPCDEDDHACVDGLSCSRGSGSLSCRNSNVDAAGHVVSSFHLQNYCPGPDLDHSWPGSHEEGNFRNPALTRFASPNDGFVRVNDVTEPGSDHAEMGFYDQGDLPFYYGLAQTFAISDRYFCSVIGPTFPNRSYLVAATSFGHLTTDEEIPPLPPAVPPPGGYKPITGTIMDLLDAAGVTWTNFFADVPQSAVFRGLDLSHAQPVTSFFADTAAARCALPAVSFVDPAFGSNLLGINPGLVEFDEHPPTDIRAGQFFVSQVVNALRASDCWKDSILFIMYDEHGGFYDHVAPPRARQGGHRNPDGIDPGQCEDLSNPPISTQPGGGANCSISRGDAASICPGFTPTGDYPAFCADFDQLGFRVPLMAVSPFSRPHYVSHQVADHTSLIAFIEKRFLSAAGTGDGDHDGDDHGGKRPHLTERDKHAHTLEDLFDFDRSPSLNAPVGFAPPASPADPGCPFRP